MKASDIMTTKPACCSVNTPLSEVARMMVQFDCGEIPVLDDAGKPIGVVTDRDICCRTVALGLNPLEMSASQCMSSPCITVSENDPIEHCCELLENYQIRRVPVIDADGRCTGILAQADIAIKASATDAERVVRRVSERLKAARGTMAQPLA